MHCKSRTPGRNRDLNVTLPVSQLGMNAESQNFFELMAVCVLSAEYNFHDMGKTIKLWGAARRRLKI